MSFKQFNELSEGGGKRGHMLFRHCKEKVINESWDEGLRVFVSEGFQNKGYREAEDENGEGIALMDASSKPGDEGVS